MKLKIKLDNPKYCLGCPYVQDYFFTGIGTGNYRCIADENYRIKIQQTKTSYIPTRPKKCIKENGE